MPRASARTDEVRIEYVPLSELAKWPRNPKKHDLEELGRSIERWGFTVPIALDEGTGKMIAGHGRLAALEVRKASGRPAPGRIKVDRKSGEWLAPILRGLQFADEQEAEAYLVADNRLTERAGWDNALLSAILEDQVEAQRPLDGVGFDEEELQRLLSGASDPNAPAGDEGGDPIIPGDDPQREPHIKAEVVVEIQCARSDLNAIKKVLDEWQKRPGVQINISTS